MKTPGTPDFALTVDKNRLKCRIHRIRALSSIEGLQVRFIGELSQVTSDCDLVAVIGTRLVIYSIIDLFQTRDGNASFAARIGGHSRGGSRELSRYTSGVCDVFIV